MNLSKKKFGSSKNRLKEKLKQLNLLYKINKSGIKKSAK